MYSQAVQQISNSISQERKIALSVDVWTSPNKLSFLAVLGYFMTDDFVVKKILLSFSMLKGSHVGSMLDMKCVDTLDIYG